MNRLEYREVMKTVGIPFNSWDDFTISFGGTYYAVVEGSVPLVVANAIYEKYPGNPYGIRVNGGCNDWNPNKIFPTYYHIDTKEGLVIFITEMKDYFARKYGLPETEVQRFDELMSNINSEILKKVNPSISTYEWMKGDEENSKNFSQTISSGQETDFGKKFRKAIDDFDKAVNPFINKEIELDEIENYLKKVNISANTWNHEDGKKRKNCCQMHITDLGSGNKVNYRRDHEGFLYGLDYILGEKQYLTILHYYSTRVPDENERGEFVAIDYWGENISQKIDIRYNLTKGVAGTTYGKKIPITSEQEKFVYDELLNAISLVSSVTLDNMKKKGIPKQLLPKKK